MTRLFNKKITKLTNLLFIIKFAPTIVKRMKAETVHFSLAENNTP